MTDTRETLDRNGLEEIVQQQNEQIDHLEAEVKRLREALEDCRQMADELQGNAYGVTPADIHRRAEIALDAAEDGQS